MSTDYTSSATVGLFLIPLGALEKGGLVVAVFGLALVTATLLLPWNRIADAMQEHHSTKEGEGGGLQRV